MTDTELKGFIADAKRVCYASGVQAQPGARKGSVQLEYRKGDASYLDSWYGGVQFCGQEIVWHKETAIWGMNYWGESIDAALAAIPSGDGAGDLSSNDEGSAQPFDMPAFLKEALSKVTEDAPFRGPNEYKRSFGKLHAVYSCRWTGDFSAFTGDETITIGGRALFRLFFHGGKIGS